MESKEDLKDYMLKEIDIIEGIINRMAHNSFLIKGWTITLVVATLLLKGKKYQVLIALIPLITFWILDAYFLQLERLYRELYNWVVENRMKTDKNLFVMNISELKKDAKVMARVKSIFYIMFSKTLLLFYGSILLLLIIYSIILFLIQKGGC